jgi:transposase
VKQALLACRAVRRVASVPRGVSLQANLFDGVASGRSCRCRRRPGLLPPLSSRRLRELGRRVYDLTAPINDVDKHLDCSALLHRTPPSAPSWPRQCRPLLITAGGNIDRFPNEAVFGGLCGVAPLRASSGKSHRVRLHHRGNRQTNRGTKLPSAVSYASSPASFIRR